MWQYLIVFVLSFSFLQLYFRVADKFNIVDKPNERSSHTIVTLRGGGIVYWFAALLYFAFHYPTEGLFFIAITLVCFISFYDDIVTVPNKLRLSIQFVALSLILYSLNAFQLLPWWLIIVTYVVAVGIINAYNFMDGINGITGLYSIAVLTSFYYINSHFRIFEFADFILYPMIASVAFLFFNYRKKAKCFAGDVGSIVIAFWLIYLLIKLSMVTNSAVWILFFAVYGVDSVCTILHRLYLRQNIFKAHRLHFYQILCNEYKIDHRIVSLAYAIMQLIVSYTVIVLFYKNINEIIISLITLVPLAIIYLIKFYLLKNYK